MEVDYEEKIKPFFEDLEKMSGSKGLLQRKVDPKTVKTIKRRVLELKASNTFSIYLSTGLGKPHSLEGDLKGCYAISVTGNYRLIIELCCDISNTVAINNCEAIIIKGIVDYHGRKNNWIIP